MSKFINPGLMKTNRRNVLRGSVLAGAAAVTGAGVIAAPRTPKLTKVNETSAKLYKTAGESTNAAPADLSGYTRVKQDMVAPP